MNWGETILRSKLTFIFLVQPSQFRGFPQCLFILSSAQQFLGQRSNIVCLFCILQAIVGCRDLSYHIEKSVWVFLSFVSQLGSMMLQPLYAIIGVLIGSIAKRLIYSRKIRVLSYKSAEEEYTLPKLKFFYTIICFHWKICFYSFTILYNTLHFTILIKLIPVVYSSRPKRKNKANFRES